jgi:fibronectin type 3 domain-containing protein
MLIPPTDLSAVATNGQITLTWTPMPGAVSFNIYRSTVPGGEGTTPYFTGVTGGTFTDNAVANDGTTYYYTLTAVDPFGAESAQSLEVAITALLV